MGPSMAPRGGFFDVRTAALCALALVMLGGPAFAQRATVSGVVLNALNREPAGGATIKLARQPPATTTPRQESLSTTAGPDGSFRFDDVEPQTYWIVANLQGYLPGEYGQRTATGTGMPLTLEAGQRGNVRLSIWPTSGISGRVVDGDGDPIGRAQVLALRNVYRDGKPSMTIAQTVTTNDRGEYRMFWLAPGTYRVAARSWDADTFAPLVNISPPRRFGTSEQGTAPVVTRRAAANGTPIEETFIPIYAPSTPDPQLATPISLAAGDNVAGVDIQVVGNRVPAHHVRGVFVRTDDNGRSALLLMVPRTETPFAVVATAATTTGGTFDIGGVAPGSYFLFAQDASALLPIEVGDGDVDNITLVQPSGISLKGHLTIDRGPSPTQAEEGVTPSNFQIQMTRDPFLVGAPDGGPRFNPAPEENGAINLNSVAPGDYRLGVRPFGMGPDGESLTGRPVIGPMRNAYVKSAHLGGADVLAGDLHLPGPTPQPLDVVIGLNGGEIDGTVSDGREPSANVVVIAVPDGGSRGRSDRYKRASTDGRGRFTMTGLAPGDYTFYAWDDVERGAWESAEFIRAFEGRGRFERVREGKNDAIDLTLIVGR